MGKRAKSLQRRTRKRVENEEFMTSKSLAEKLVHWFDDRINLNQFKTIVEPAAGDGVFMDAVRKVAKKPKIIGYDLNPKAKGIRKGDFLKKSLRGIAKNSDDVLCIGNVPFGRRGSLAGDFIRRCSTFSDHIAFILPLGFLHGTYLDQHVPCNFHIRHSKTMRGAKFHTPTGLEKKLNVAFIYFENLGFERPKKNKRQLKPNSKWELLVGPSKKQRKSADLRIRGTGEYAGTCFHRDQADFFINKTRTDDWFIVLSRGYKKDRKKISQSLNEHQWRFHNTVPTVRYLDKNQLTRIVNKIMSDL